MALVACKMPTTVAKDVPESARSQTLQVVDMASEEEVEDVVEMEPEEIYVGPNPDPKGPKSVEKTAYGGVDL